MMNNEPYISVIIPTYNRAGSLNTTVASFTEQDYPRNRYEIIVANNNSSDDTSAVVLEWQAKSPVTFRSVVEYRQGVHYARNSAAKMARGDILYFTDDDMEATPSLLTEIVKIFELNPLIGSATGKILPKFAQRAPDWVQKDLINANLSLTEIGRTEELIISTNDLVYSCHQAVRRDAFFLCGGFNPENTAGVWLGDGETGLGIKLKKAGYKFAYTSRSVIYHLIPASRMTLRYLMKRQGNQGYCDAFTEYRSHRNKKKIIPLMIRRNTIGLLWQFAYIIAKITAGRHTWRQVPALFMYFIKRNVHDFRLYSNAEFRAMAEIDDWLSEGHD